MHRNLEIHLIMKPWGLIDFSLVLYGFYLFGISSSLEVMEVS